MNNINNNTDGIADVSGSDYGYGSAPISSLINIVIKNAKLILLTVAHANSL